MLHVLYLPVSDYKCYRYTFKNIEFNIIVKIIINSQNTRQMSRMYNYYHNIKRTLPIYFIPINIMLNLGFDNNYL